VLQNFEFALTVEPDNQTVRRRLSDIRERRKAGRPTVPSTIGEERLTNPFLRAINPEMRAAIGMPNASAVEVFAELRKRKNAFWHPNPQRRPFGTSNDRVITPVDNF